MRRPIGVTLHLFFLPLILTLLAAPAEASDWQGDWAPKETLRLDVFKGHIHVQPSTIDRIEVSARMSGRPSEIDQVKRRGQETTSELSIRAVYPRRESRDDPCSRVRIDRVVSLPEGARLIASTEVGNIEALRLSDPAKASSTVGDIRVDTSAYAVAETTKGNIAVSLGSSDWQDALRLRATNGNIEVAISGRADLELSATTTNGSFDTDLFPFERKRHGIPGARIGGQLGRGGRELVLESVTEDLELVRREH